MNPPPGSVRDSPLDSDTAIVWDQTRSRIIEDYQNTKRNGEVWKSTTTGMSGYEIFPHDTEEEARTTHLVKNPGRESWHLGIPVIPPNYVQRLRQALQPESLRQSQQSLVEQNSRINISPSHPERSHSEVKPRNTTVGDQEGGPNTVLARGGPYKPPLESEAGWGNEPLEIREPPRIMSFKSSDIDGWKD
jgi:hypothetical protein